MFLLSVVEVIIEVVVVVVWVEEERGWRKVKHLVVRIYRYAFSLSPLAAKVKSRGVMTLGKREERS